MKTEHQIIHGDALEVLPQLDQTFDVVVADPPYIIGGSSIAKPRGKRGTWPDMMNAATWYAQWINLATRRLRPTGHLLMFGNWRSLATYLRASSLLDTLRLSCMVWNKKWMGPAAPAQLWELILWFGMPEAAIEDRKATDIIDCKWNAGHMGRSGHPAEKPVELIVDLLRLAAPPGGAVLDPFAGSGTVGNAARQLKMSYTGIEMEERWATYATAEA